MLDDTRRKVVPGPLDLFPFSIEGAHLNLPCTWNLSSDIGDTHSPFAAFQVFRSTQRYLRINHDDRLGFGTFLLVLCKGRDEDSDAFMHLGSREAHAVVLDHRVDEVVDQ